MLVWLEYANAWELMTVEVRMLLLKISPATIDRLLCPLKLQMHVRGLSTTKQGTFRKTNIPIRMHFWDIKEPGHMQADTVAHCGGSLGGAFGNSLTMTDIDSTWTENRAIWTKNSFRVFQQIKDIEEGLPFSIKSYASDNGTEVLSQRIYHYFEVHSEDPDRRENKERVRQTQNALPTFVEFFRNE